MGPAGLLEYSAVMMLLVIMGSHFGHRDRDSDSESLRRVSVSVVAGVTFRVKLRAGTRLRISRAGAAAAGQSGRNVNLILKLELKGNRIQATVTSHSSGPPGRARQLRSGDRDRTRK
jgi:hypothetical protein